MTEFSSNLHQHNLEAIYSQGDDEDDQSSVVSSVYYQEEGPSKEFNNEQAGRISDSHSVAGSMGGASSVHDLDKKKSQAVTETQQERQLVEEMAQKEARRVVLWRNAVFAVLLGTAILVVTMTYLFLDQKDTQDFETSFREFALTIRDSTEFNLRGVIGATNGLSEVLTSEAINTDSKWPFVTLSSFEVLVRNTRSTAGSELVVLAPFVSSKQVKTWNDYSINNQGWLDESFATYTEGRTDLAPIPSSIYRFGRFKGRTVLKPENEENGHYPMAPFWQMSRPPFDTSIINYNALSEKTYQDMYDSLLATGSWVMGLAGKNDLIDYTVSEADHDKLHDEARASTESEGFANNHPHTALMFPVWDTNTKMASTRRRKLADRSTSDVFGNETAHEERKMVAMVINILPWDTYLQRLLPKGVNGVYCVLRNSAGQAFTYEINGDTARYLGEGELHERTFDGMEYKIDFADFLGEKEYSGDGNLKYWFSVYPGRALRDSYETTTPLIFTIVVGSIFVFMAIVFLVYDRTVVRKNNKILDAAANSNAILASLFPKSVKARLLEEKAEEVKAGKNNERRRHRDAKSRDAELAGFLSGQVGNFDENEISKSKPLADLYPECTVLFADVVGFTAWSSSRDPASVFTLLETIYGAFDKIANRRGVYKVETIGDCYVACAGVPNPRDDHFSVMCRFAMDCLRKMKEQTTKLEKTLGPDTADLNLRFGIHSGPVTAGVLRGERSRFQLFGDTMNVCARMETNSLPGRIHLSETTAKLLIDSGRMHWIEMREEKISAKGKGEMQTYWLTRTSQSGSHTGMSETHVSESLSSPESGGSDEDPNLNNELDKKTLRLVSWNTQTLLNCLQRLKAAQVSSDADLLRSEDAAPIQRASNEMGTPLDEITDTIQVVRYYPKEGFPSQLDLDPEVEHQLETYCTAIASMYSPNPFHNFEHASHVLMSLLKLFSRIVKPTRKQNQDFDTFSEACDQSLGLACDPLVQFTCLFAALIHDVDHAGVPNNRLAEERPSLGTMYNNRSIAEQNSFDLSWTLLMDDRFQKLRDAIYRNPQEEARFRQLLVNAVMATDIMDADLKQHRSRRWNAMFNSAENDEPTDEPTSEEMPPEQAPPGPEERAAAVMELLIQASDVAHTLQHFEIYMKWNERLFNEMYQAYLQGRATKDPCTFWFQGEIGFLDFYVIPLARQLQQCGIFGKSGNEFLEAANTNRRVWEATGEKVVAEYRQRIEERQLKAANASSSKTGQPGGSILKK